MRYVGPQVSPLKVTRFTGAVQGALNQAMIETKLRFENTTRTWETPVEFTARKINAETAVVGTDNQIYVYVNDGTEPHEIRPRSPGGTLAFQTGYQAKTQPNVAFSQGGGAFGDYVHAKAVQHPGTEARDFDEAIADQAVEYLQRFMQFAMQSAIRQ